MRSRKLITPTFALVFFVVISGIEWAQSQKTLRFGIAVP